VGRLETSTMQRIQLACPNSGVPLVVEGSVARGEGVSYPIRDGIPDFLDEMPSIGGQNVHTDYRIARRPKEGRARKVHGEIVHGLERRYIEETERRLGRTLDVLDVGCGSAKFRAARGGGPKESLQPFVRSARFYAGIDPSWEMLRAASAPDSQIGALGRYLLVRAIAERLPFSALSFDLVFIKSALDHCADARSALAEAHRVLRPGGFVLITLQNFGSWQRRVLATVMPGTYERHRRRDHHTSPFTPRLLREQLEATGFEVEAFSEMGYAQVSRYRLGILEDLLFLGAELADGRRGLVNGVARFDSLLSRLAPGLGAAMFCWARRV
jgi:SAM-dependent methyltransferase